MAAIERGEKVVITYYGEPRAKLVPIVHGTGKRTRPGANPAFGLWSDRCEEMKRSPPAHCISSRSTL